MYILKGIRVMITVLLFVPISWVAFLHILGDRRESTLLMPDWFNKAFEYVSGTGS
jgi:hypothetical protein